MENILDRAFSVFIPDQFAAVGWIVIYVLGVGLVSLLNYVTADEDELEDLGDDLDNL